MREHMLLSFLILLTVDNIQLCPRLVSKLILNYLDNKI